VVKYFTVKVSSDTSKNFLQQIIFTWNIFNYDFFQSTVLNTFRHMLVEAQLKLPCSGQLVQIEKPMAPTYYIHP